VQFFATRSGGLVSGREVWEVGWVLRGFGAREPETRLVGSSGFVLVFSVPWGARGVETGGGGRFCRACGGVVTLFSACKIRFSAWDESRPEGRETRTVSSALLKLELFEDFAEEARGVVGASCGWWVW
jgi:hypothetical protein